MKKAVSTVLVFILCMTLFSFGACTNTQTETEAYDIIATVFPAYDFAKAVAGDQLKIRMLISPGAEAHGFSPTLDDLAAIQNCKLFIYTGGETDAWATEQFKSGNLDTSAFKALAMTDCVELIAEPDAVESHDHNDEGEAHAHVNSFDEHIWTSPANAILLIDEICTQLSAVYPEKTDIFRANADDYIQQITAQTNAMWEIVHAADNKLLVFENRFPFVYLCEYFGLSHISAFGSCGSNTEVSASTLDTLVNTIKNNNLPCILYLEFSDTVTADQVVKATGCAKHELHSYHNVTQEDFDNGVTYVDLMKRNTQTLKEALS